MSQPSYATNDPRGWGGDPKRGAALGRPTVTDADKSLPVKLYLRRVRINSGGYCPKGTYFGIGRPLYWAADADGEVDFVIRADDREDAKLEVLRDYPNATFFN